jgi:hypothetical protein
MLPPMPGCSLSNIDHASAARRGLFFRGGQGPRRVFLRAKGALNPARALSHRASRQSEQNCTSSKQAAAEFKIGHQALNSQYPAGLWERSNNGERADGRDPRRAGGEAALRGQHAQSIRYGRTWRPADTEGSMAAAGLDLAVETFRIGRTLCAQEARLLRRNKSAQN